jgi:hypothetical protein
MVNSINIFVYLHLEMIFLNNQDKNYSIFRIKHLLRKKKKSLRRLSEQKKKIIEQIAFYEGILEKLQQYEYEGDVHYLNEENELVFTKDEIFYISMILGMRGCYERMKQLSERSFDEKSQKLHIDLQKWLRRVLKLDPTLFADYEILKMWNYQIDQINSTVTEMRTMHAPEHFLNQYQIWVSNLFTSFSLLDDYTIWRQNELRRMFMSDSPLISYCDCPAMCFCKVDDTEEQMYMIICLNVFFQRYLHKPESRCSEIY